MDPPNEPLIQKTSDPKDAIVLNVHHNIILPKVREERSTFNQDGLPGNQVIGIPHVYLEHHEILIIPVILDALPQAMDDLL